MASRGQVYFFVCFFVFFPIISTEGQVISVSGINEWNELLRMGLESNKLVVADFTASWCGLCRFMDPFFDELAEKTPRVTFLSVDVDEVDAVAQRYKVESIPAFLFFKEGEVVDRVVGTSREEVQSKVDEYGGVDAAA